MHVEQEIHGDDTLAIQSVLEADTERKELLLLEKQLNDKLKRADLTVDEGTEASMKLKEVYTKMEEIEADKAESKYFF